MDSSDYEPLKGARACLRLSEQLISHCKAILFATNVVLIVVPHVLQVEEHTKVAAGYVMKAAVRQTGSTSGLTSNVP